jgi:amidase
MAFKEYGNYDAVGLADLVRRKEVSPKELLDEAIARTAKVDPEINAVVVKHYDHAERQITKGLPDGPFTGVPFLLKDLDLLEGTRTTFGASVYKDESSRPGELHPWALTDPDVSVSAHPALIVQPSSRATRASGQRGPDRARKSCGSSAVPAAGVA